MLLPLVVSGAEEATKKYKNYIKDDGHVVRNGYRTEEQFPLTKRHWYQTDKGGVGAIFIDIPAVNFMNGYCFGGTAFKHHESGGLIMKCFNFNKTEKMIRLLLFETKDHHYIDSGSCHNVKKYTAYNTCDESVMRMPLFWYSMSDVGDPISVDECKAIQAKTRKYNFDVLCQ